MIDSEKAWRAVKSRDRSFDGQFVTGVLTTGIYCRPSCAARHPKRENVRFFASGAEARAAGLRACRRCRPDDVARDEAAVKSVIDAIRMNEDTPKLNELATLTDYSPAHLQKIFKRATGLSPAAYARALKLERAQDALRDEDRVTDAIYDAGYGSASRFYENSRGKMGMAAKSWKDGGAGETIRWAVVTTGLGDMMVAATARGVCRISFGQGEAELAEMFPKATLERGGAKFEELVGKVVEAVEAPAQSHAIPLDVRGTAFQERVWEELQKIPPGETRSYGDIAAAIGRPKAVRAVGTANGANRIAVLIPCHRVIAADGTLGGYAYGLEMKEKLLEKERE